MAASMVDAVFGRLRATEDKWVGKVAAGSIGPAVKIGIDCRHGWKQVRKPPTESQQRAFTNFLRSEAALMERVRGQLLEHYAFMWPEVESDPFRPRNFSKLPRPDEKERILAAFGSPSIEIPIQESISEGRDEECVILVFNDPFWPRTPVEAMIVNCSEIEIDAGHGG